MLKARLLCSRVLLLASCSSLSGQKLPQANRWVGTWAVAPYSAPIPGNQPVGNRTYREIVHLSQGASRIRAVFSNEFGTSGLTIESATIALSDGQSRVHEAQGKRLTFSGKEQVVISAGAKVLSDPVALEAPALSDVAVSFYLPTQNIPVFSVHPLASQINYVVEGNQVNAPSLPSAKQITTYPILRTLESQASSDVRAIACLGDSITDGRHSTTDANARWPNVLAKCLIDSEGEDAASVLNLGIGGNRLLEDGKGPNALSRLDRDVLAQSNVRYLIVLQGIDDIGEGYGTKESDGTAAPSAGHITAAYEQIIARAHAHNIAVYGATLLPFQQSMFYSEEGEAVREQVNKWIRSSSAFDAVLDFDAVVRDETDARKLAARFDSGDHLHPNDRGYKAIADSVPLQLFRK